MIKVKRRQKMVLKVEKREKGKIKISFSFSPEYVKKIKSTQTVRKELGDCLNEGIIWKQEKKKS